MKRFDFSGIDIRMGKDGVAVFSANKFRVKFSPLQYVTMKFEFRRIHESGQCTD
jgi:hypothetical protein